MASETGSDLTPEQKTQHDRDRAQRWHKISIDQLGYSLNLFLTFTIALLGYWFSLLRDEKFPTGPTSKYVFLFSFVALVLAALCGVVCVLVRVYDFRGTSRRASGSANAPSQDYVRVLDRWVYRLFTAQIVTFFAGSVLLGAALLLTFGGKLL